MLLFLAQNFEMQLQRTLVISPGAQFREKELSEQK